MFLFAVEPTESRFGVLTVVIGWLPTHHTATMLASFSCHLRHHFLQVPAHQTCQFLLSLMGILYLELMPFCEVGAQMFERLNLFLGVGIDFLEEIEPIGKV